MTSSRFLAITYKHLQGLQYTLRIHKGEAHDFDFADVMKTIALKRLGHLLVHAFIMCDVALYFRSKGYIIEC